MGSQVTLTTFYRRKSKELSVTKAIYLGNAMDIKYHQ